MCFDLLYSIPKHAPIRHSSPDNKCRQLVPDKFMRPLKFKVLTSAWSDLLIVIIITILSLTNPLPNAYLSK